MSGLGKMFGGGGGGGGEVMPVPVVPTTTSPEALAAQKAEREMLRKRKGRMSTILTGGEGVGGDGMGGKKTLLGA